MYQKMQALIPISRDICRYTVDSQPSAIKTSEISLDVVTKEVPWSAATNQRRLGRSKAYHRHTTSLPKLRATAEI
jgi:hypothetical protein